VESDADLFEAVVAAVVPEKPFLSVKNRERFVTGIVVPFVFAGTDDRIRRMTLPAANAVA
jgi:hypothetical protein